MSSVSARAPVAALRPAASASSPRFLGDSGRVGLAKSTRRDVAVQAKGSWLPGLPSPAYLDGSLAGDNGFDPLALAEDPEDLRWFVQAELVNGRWAMLGVAGMLIPEVLTKAGLLNAPEWYDAGKETYFASSSYSLPPHECGYPGSVFNPLNFAPTLENKEKELANGRLAMLAFLGFLVQHNVTGKGPFENLQQHLADPWHNTIIQTISGQ
ncbi:unnamed protein product [Triticum turgidum subsp. durum]|uniref:Chlorophyll a-b binding protein, chloroplastic n=1 Tax=Triticum turgidum subsp. durum TaxID=4567 RepID=A0A9R0XA29_TRITD|nr:unnamed protein product [Triticum turgidum subsp. durum]VAI32882.1 unnamed protein product [Triticum turgidum subsp. durum]